MAETGGDGMRRPEARSIRAETSKLSRYVFFGIPAQSRIHMRKIASLWRLIISRSSQIWTRLLRNRLLYPRFHMTFSE